MLHAGKILGIQVPAYAKRAVISRDGFSGQTAKTAELRFRSALLAALLATTRRKTKARAEKEQSSMFPMRGCAFGGNALSETATHANRAASVEAKKFTPTIRKLGAITRS